MICLRVDFRTPHSWLLKILTIFQQHKMLLLAVTTHPSSRRDHVTSAGGWVSNYQITSGENIQHVIIYPPHPPYNITSTWPAGGRAVGARRGLSLSSPQNTLLWVWVWKIFIYFHVYFFIFSSQYQNYLKCEINTKEISHEFIEKWNGKGAPLSFPALKIYKFTLLFIL